MIENIIVTKLSALMKTGKVVEIYIENDQFVQKGDPILAITAEKANVEIEAPIEGYVKLQCEKGQDYEVGFVLGYVASTLEELKTTQDQDILNTKDKEGIDKVVSEQQPVVRALPIAKRLAKEKGVDLGTIKGTGCNGMITKQDVEKAIEERKERDREIELDAVKKGMFEHMERAKNYVQATTFMEVDLRTVKELRQQYRYSYTSYISDAVVKSLKSHPLINSSYQNGKIIIKKNINLGIAMDNKGKLFVPVLKNAENMGVKDIENAIKFFKEKAENNKISIEDLSDGSFTVTNSGIFGSLCFAPVINYPQSAIMGIGKIVERPVVINNGVTIRPIMIISLGYDHRIIEGSAAVKFLAEVKENLENFTF